MLKEDDIINVKSWMSLGDCNYEIDHDDDSIPESGVVYCNIEHIHKLFAKCEQTDNEYVVVSGFSDYGVAHQTEQRLRKEVGEKNSKTIRSNKQSSKNIRKPKNVFK